MTPEPASRLTRRASLGAGGAVIAAIALDPTLAPAAGPTTAAEAPTQSQQSVNQLLANALTAEWSAEIAYTWLVAQPFTTRATSQAFERCRGQDHEHASWLATMLARDAAPLPSLPGPEDINGLLGVTRESDAIALVRGIEQHALNVYFAIVRLHTHDPLLRPSAALIAAHAQQLALLRAISGQTPVPQAFETQTTP